MGYSVSWVAFQGAAEADVLALTGLRGTETVQDVPDAPFQVATLPGGWTILFANDVMFAEPDNLKRLSRHHTILGCMIEEHATVSMSSCYVGGEMLWEVVFDVSSTESELMVSGSPPPELAAVRAQASLDHERSADGDFDTPIDLAEAVCGYRHDTMHFDWGTIGFTVAVRPESAAVRPSLWRRLLWESPR